MEAAIKSFFSSSRFAVVGASPDPSKFGHKVFAWYLSRSLPATPVNPRAPSILEVPAIKSIKELPADAAPDTSVSIITHPAITIGVLRDAADIGVRRVWMQPGAFDEECLRFCRDKGLVAVAGGTEDGWGPEGACVLVHGDEGVKAARL